MGGLVRSLVRLALLGWVAAWVVAVVGAIAVRRRTTAVDAPDADEVVLVGIFGPLDFRSTASGFRGGLVECWMGGGVIDLRSATLDPDGADMTLRAVFGGGQLLVPASWTVTTDVRGLGGIADGRPGEGRVPGGPELRIDATVLFGGFAIASESAEDVQGDRPATDDEPAPAVLTV